MENDKTLESLLKQKKEIELAIRMHTAPALIRCGTVKVEKKEGKNVGAWQVCAMTTSTNCVYETREAYSQRTGDKYDSAYYWDKRKIISTVEAGRWSPFIRKDTKEELCESIRTILTDLNDLLNELNKLDEKTISDRRKK